MGNKRVGRPKNDERLDSRVLFKGIWTLLNLVNRYREVIEEPSRRPSKELREAIRGLEALAKCRLEPDQYVQKKPDISNGEVMVARFCKVLTEIYRECNGKGSARPLTTAQCEQRIRSVLEAYVPPSTLERVVSRLVLNGREIADRGGPAVAAKDMLGKAFEIGSRRTQENRAKNPSNPEPPYYFLPDMLSLKAFEQMLIASGFTKKTAERVVEILLEDDNFPDKAHREFTQRDVDLVNEHWARFMQTQRLEKS